MSGMILILGLSCTTVPWGSPSLPARRVTAGEVDADTPGSDIRIALVEQAYALLGKNRLQVRGRSFTLDCTGVVLAAYWGAGIDLSSPLSRYSGNGVARLYGYLSDFDLLAEGSEAWPGDIIFWDNTYDRNGNGKVDDPLTHVGMVVSVAENGDIAYIHHNYRQGIILEKMNPLEPSTYSRQEGDKTVIVNSFMRMRGSPEYDKNLSGELMRAWGRAWRLK
jgi:hypothetical protein